MGTVMRGLKLIAAETTSRWSDGNWAPSWTAERRLMLFILYWKGLRRFLNGKNGRHRWRDELKEHRMGGEGEEVNMHWLRSLINRDAVVHKPCARTQVQIQKAFASPPFFFFFGYVFSHCSSAVYATAGQINQGELEQNWSEADRGSGQIQSEIEKTMWEYRMNDREAGGNKMRESTGDEEERREWQEEERIPESVREEQHYVIFVWLNLTGNMREGLLHLPFFADNIASSLFFLLLCWWWWFLFIATSFKTWIIAYF